MPVRCEPMLVLKQVRRTVGFSATSNRPNIKAHHPPKLLGLGWLIAFVPNSMFSHRHQLIEDPLLLNPAASDHRRRRFEVSDMQSHPNQMFSPFVHKHCERLGINGFLQGAICPLEVALESEDHPLRLDFQFVERMVVEQEKSLWLRTGGATGCLLSRTKSRYARVAKIVARNSIVSISTRPPDLAFERSCLQRATNSSIMNWLNEPHLNPPDGGYILNGYA